MVRKYSYFIEGDKKIEDILKYGTFLDYGNHGVIYKSKDGKIVKLFCEPEVFKKELSILEKAKHSKSFPKVYYTGKYYIVREYISGERLDKYIKTHPYDKRLYINLYNLLKELKRLKFKKIDLRLRDLYVQKDLSIRVIDPKNNLSKLMPYPRHLMKNLYSIHALNEFLMVVDEISPIECQLWVTNFYQYLEES